MQGSGRHCLGAQCLKELKWGNLPILRFWNFAVPPSGSIVPKVRKWPPGTLCTASQGTSVPVLWIPFCAHNCLRLHMWHFSWQNNLVSFLQTQKVYWNLQGRPCRWHQHKYYCHGDSLLLKLLIHFPLCLMVISSCIYDKAKSVFHNFFPSNFKELWLF